MARWHPSNQVLSGGAEVYLAGKLTETQKEACEASVWSFT